MILVDTGFFVALAVRTDRHHAASVAALKRYQDEGLVTTWPVLTEATHLLQRVGGSVAAEALLASVHAGFASIFELRHDHLSRVVALMEKYRNLPMDLADASLVLCAEESGEGRIFSTDTRDFGAYRFKRRKPFRNLLRV